MKMSSYVSIKTSPTKYKHFKVDEEVKMGFYNRLQELTIWPTLENKPPEVSDDYWDFVIDFVHTRWKQPYSLEGIE